VYLAEQSDAQQRLAGELGSVFGRVGCWRYGGTCAYRETLLNLQPKGELVAKT
jgi:hypothetical protein